MNNIVPINQARMPSTMIARRQAGGSVNKNFSGGIRDSFPLLSIKGKVFRIRKDGQETPLVDQATRQAIPFLDVILVNSSPVLSKAYYERGFDDGEMAPPDCWSLDGIKPDPSVVNKQNPTCVNCPKNIFGSAVSQDGNKRGGKACADSKRVAVMMPSHLGQPEPLIFLLKVPATSLKNIKGYADLLDRQGWDTFSCITRLQFDYNQAYPKLVFNFVDSLNDQEYDEVVRHAESPYVASMLAAPDFDANPTIPAPNPAVQPRVRQSGVVLGDDQSIPEQTQQAPVQNVQTTKPRQQVDVGAQQLPDTVEPHQVMDKWIELATGEMLNPATGEIRPREPQEQKPQPDPRTIKTNDGRYYNLTSQSFVTGPNVGDQAVGDVPQQPVEKKPRSPKKPKPETKAEEQAAAPVQEAAPAEVQEPEQEVANDSEIRPAPADLNALLGKMIPTRN